MTKLTNFVFHSSLAIAIIFNIVAVGRAKAEDVNNFEGLRNAIMSSQNEIVIKNTIDFTANGPVINYSDIVISGPSENASGLLDGNSSYKFFIFGKNAKNISLKNLHLKNGSSGIEAGYDNGGGAIYLNTGVVVNLEGLTFSNNQTRSQGGAIYSYGTDNNNRNSLNFTGETTFDENKTIGTIGSNCGAVFAHYSTLTFGEGPATFKSNSSAGDGGAIYIWSSSLTFGGLATFKGNNSAGGGGAIYGGNGTELIFGENVTFTENSSVGYGGAIRSYGENATNKNILKFEGNATFVRNSATRGGNGDGGAISAENSSLTFGKLLATFKNNRSEGSGGAIYGGNRTELIFDGEVTFTENSSVGNGGAICSFGENATDKNILEFKANATFVGNSITGGGNGYGGAIFVINSSLTFGGLATFENNKTRFGGAICASDGSSIEFNNGLRLIGNTTGNTDSGALHIQGNSNDELATITIVQKNPLVPTEFRGNISGADRNGSNAVYMERHSQFKFTVEKGNVDVYDVFTGDKTKDTNIITINRDNGWVNIEKGGSLENVKVVNRGNLKLAGESRG
ncbi:MAG: hypothetical protein LBB13_01365, partial [Rickettsiales bacterium]|nr:hypothetical protein [Rickettsiales bacterium]